MKPSTESTEWVKDAKEDTEMIESASDGMESVIEGVVDERTIVAKARQWGSVETKKFQIDAVVDLMERLEAWRRYGLAVREVFKSESEYPYEAYRNVKQFKIRLEELGEWPKEE